MKLNEVLLAKRAERPPGKGRQTLTGTDDSSGWAAAVEVDHIDQVGCLVWEMRVQRTPADSPAQEADLRNWAERVAGRTTGLLEDLKVLEVDANRNEALLRSDAPACRGEERYFYEIHLKGTESATLRRYRAASLGKSQLEQVAFSLTHETLAKLVTDLTADK
jgi:hypothetical protein